MFNKDFLKKPLVVFTLSTTAVCLIGYLNVKIYKDKQEQLAVAASKKYTKRAIAEESKPYSFGGACSSQGSWTQQALTQTATIREALKALRDDPNCKGVESVVAKLETAKDSMEPGNGAEEHANWNTLPTDMRTLSGIMGKNGAQDRKDIIPILMGKTIENTVLAGSIKSLAKRSQRVLTTGLDLLDQSMDVLPRLDECMGAHPDQAVALFGASLKLASAFISSGETPVGRMGTTVGKLVTFMRMKKFSKILAKLNQTEYWMSMSCILETTTEAYCSTKDAYEMLNYSIKENDLRKKVDASKENNPLEGYYLLVREIPIITQWLQKVQSGVTPRRSVDLIFKDETRDTYSNYQKASDQMLVIYTEQMQIIAAARTSEEKSNSVLNMVKILTRLLTGSGGKDGLNFFTGGKPESLIPFYLIGRTSIPDEVSGVNAFASTNPRPVWSYMENGGKYQSEFQAPEALSLKIGENLNRLISESSESASKYFQDRMVVDPQNLVDESITSQGLTVYKSLKNVSNYLGKLIAKAKVKRTNLIQLPNIIETKKRIDDVLSSYNVIKESVNKYLEMQKDSDSKADIEALNEMMASDESLKDAYKVIIDKAYKNFNILLQNDTYLITRMSTFVTKDYTQRVTEGADMTEYQRDIMIIAGKNLIDRIAGVNRMNPNDVKIDLAAAQVINKRNLDAVEEFFIDPFVGAIAEITDVAFGRSDNKYGIAKASMARIVDEKMNRKSSLWEKLLISTPIRWTPAYQIMTSDYWKHKERYPLYLFGQARVKSEEDIYKSFGSFRSRLCIQALAFQNQDPFFKLCDGAFLEPVMSDNEKDKEKLSAYYSANSVYGRELYANIATRDQIIRGRDRNICAYRNFRSKNYAYWMVKNFTDEVKALKQDISDD